MRYFLPQLPKGRFLVNRPYGRKRPAAVGSLTTVFVARRICPSGVQSDDFCERLGSDPKPFAHLGLAFCFIGVWSFLAP